MWALAGLLDSQSKTLFGVPPQLAYVKQTSHVDGAALVLVVVQVDLIEGGQAAVIKEPPEGELEEAVEELRIVEELVRRARVQRGGVAQLVRVDGIEIRGVRGVFDTGLVGGRLAPQALLEVNVFEERVRFHFTGVFT